MYMKKFLFSLLLFFILPGTAGAAEIISESFHAVAKDTVVDDNIIFYGDEIIVDGTIKGDLIAFATQKIAVKGTIEGDIIAFAYELNMDNANISSDVIAFAPKAYLNGYVGETIKLYGNNIQGTLETGGDVVLNGVTYAKIGGKIGGSLFVDSSQVEFLENTQIAGSFEYESRTDAQFPNVTVQGGVERVERDMQASLMERISNTITLLFVAYLFGIVILWLVPGFYARFSKEYAESMPIRFIKGLGVMLLLTLLGVMLFLTLVGMPVGILLLSLVFVMFYISHVAFAYWVGIKIARVDAPETLPFLKQATFLLAGLTIYYAVMLIPFINVLVTLWIVGTGFGTIVDMYMNYRRITLLKG